MIDKDKIEELKQDLLLKHLNSAEELRDWVYLFFDIMMPLGHITKNANSSSVEAMWEVYEAVKNNTGNKIPGYTLMAARDCYKTISASILEVILLIHFKLTIAHTAAETSQASKAIEYHNSFLNKIIKYLNALGWTRTTQNKRRIELTTDQNEVCYIQVVVLTMKGSNSSHTNFMAVDEVDLCEPKPYQEAKMIPGVLRGRFPITLRLSTRKFNFGLMQKEIDRAHITNEKVLQWNLIDVTEHCPATRCKPENGKYIRYGRRELPLNHIDETTFNSLEISEQQNYQQIECFQGCLSCPLLSVCKTDLHTLKTPDMVGDLWKPIDAAIISLSAVDADVGEAQLLCNKPSTAGLIYPRFTRELNTLTIQKAWEQISGSSQKCTHQQFIDFLKNLGCDIEAGVDWGYTNQFAIVVAARLTGGVALILDKFTAPGFELSDCVRVGKEIQEKYNVSRFWCDPASPSYIQTFNREGMVSPKFTKDVDKGITAVRTQIVNGANARRLFILDTPNNQSLINAMGSYHWKMDAQGNPTSQPDHTEESDEMDALRYLVDNMFSGKNKMQFAMVESDKTKELNKNILQQTSLEKAAKEINEKIVQEKLGELIPDYKPPGNKKGRKILFM